MVYSAFTSKTHQDLLLDQLKIIFPHDKPLVNTRKSTNLRFVTNQYMELDIVIPRHHICFEFQDDYHYITAWYSHKPHGEIQNSDYEKKLTTLSQGLSLVIIPCWWGSNLEDLRATIEFHRPDLAHPDSTLPIPLNPPTEYFPLTGIPGVGELMLASFPPSNQINVASSGIKWWMGEKYDGIRFCWNAARRVLYTRSGNELLVKTKIKRRFPDIFIDGELWFGRGEFGNTYTLHNESLDLVHWHMLKAISFDIPSHNLKRKQFEMRYHALLTYVRKNNPLCIVPSRVVCNKNKQLHDYVKWVIDDQGEGVVLRRQGSVYEQGRSLSLLKLKITQSDGEAIVMATRDDGVHLQLPNRKVIVVPHTRVYVPLPRVGSIVSFSSDNTARASEPENASIYRVRHDLAWEDVVYNYGLQQQYLNAHSSIFGNGDAFSTRPIRYWTMKNVRDYLIGLAKHANVNPFIPTSWYHSYQLVNQSQEGKVILHKFKGGYASMLQQVFPEVQFNNAEFSKPSWRTVESRRKFFEDYALKSGFDSRNAEMWYVQPRDKILESKGAAGVLKYHNDSINSALMYLFPEVKFDIMRLNRVPIGYWGTPENRRKFMDDVAHSKGFNPLDSNAWLSITKDDILKMGGAGIIKYHKNSHRQAMTDLYPTLSFMFSTLRNHREIKETQYWTHSHNRRLFFETFAANHNFDPLVPSHWYAVTWQGIVNAGGSSALRYHNGALSKALVDLFPEVPFDFKSSTNKKAGPAGRLARTKSTLG